MPDHERQDADRRPPGPDRRERPHRRDATGCDGQGAGSRPDPRDQHRCRALPPASRHPARREDRRRVARHPGRPPRHPTGRPTGCPTGARQDTDRCGFGDVDQPDRPPSPGAPAPHGNGDHVAAQGTTAGGSTHAAVGRRGHPGDRPGAARIAPSERSAAQRRRNILRAVRRLLGRRGASEAVSLSACRCVRLDSTCGKVTPPRS